MGLYSKTTSLIEKEPDQTSLIGSRISKNSTPVHFLGTADELNSYIGLVKAMLTDEEQKQFLEVIQKNIMKIMSHVSNIENEGYFLTKDDVINLQNEIDSQKTKVSGLSKFVIPGHNVMEAQIHIARTIARRAERRFHAIDDFQLCRQAGIYLNRLSDYLFILSQMYSIKC
jgi:cob(I)alamin adenosyltransferase